MCCRGRLFFLRRTDPPKEEQEALRKAAAERKAERMRQKVCAAFWARWCRGRAHVARCRQEPAGLVVWGRRHLRPLPPTPSTLPCCRAMRRRPARRRRLQTQPHSRTLPGLPPPCCRRATWLTVGRHGPASRIPSSGPYLRAVRVGGSGGEQGPASMATAAGNLIACSGTARPVLASLARVGVCQLAGSFTPPPPRALPAAGTSYKGGVRAGAALTTGDDSADDEDDVPYPGGCLAAREHVPTRACSRRLPACCQTALTRPMHVLKHLPTVMGALPCLACLPCRRHLRAHPWQQGPALQEDCAAGDVSHGPPVRPSTCPCTCSAASAARLHAAACWGGAGGGWSGSAAGGRGCAAGARAWPAAAVLRRGLTPPGRAVAAGVAATCRALSICWPSMAGALEHPQGVWAGDIVLCARSSVADRYCNARTCLPHPATPCLVERYHARSSSSTHTAPSVLYLYCTLGPPMLFGGCWHCTSSCRTCRLHLLLSSQGGGSGLHLSATMHSSWA